MKTRRHSNLCIVQLVWLVWLFEYNIKIKNEGNIVGLHNKCHHDIPI